MSTHRSTTDDHYPTSCPHCEEELARPGHFDGEITQQQIYRRHRRIHFRWANISEDDEGRYLKGADDDGLPEDCQIDTQTFTVDISMEVVERVQVEAANEAEAKRRAEEIRDYTGEYTMDLHTDVMSFQDPSQASEQYLKAVGLLVDGDSE